MLVVSSEQARLSAARLSISTLGQFIFRRDQSVELQSEVSDFGLRQKLKTLISAKDKLTQCIPQNVHCLFFWNYSVKSRPIVTNFGTQNSEKNWHSRLCGISSGSCVYQTLHTALLFRKFSETVKTFPFVGTDWRIDRIKSFNDDAPFKSTFYITSALHHITEVILVGKLLSVVTLL